MNLGQLFTQLSYKEFSNQKVGNRGAGTIEEASKPMVTQHINEAALELHKRFVLKEKTLLITKIVDRVFYPLRSEHAVTQAELTTGPHFIQDTDEPFEDDLLQILEVYGNTGKRYKLNVAHDEQSVFTSEFDVLQVPYPDEEDTLAVTYRAKPAELSHVDETAIIAVPSALIPALRQYTAMLYFQSRGTETATMEAMKLEGQYETSIARVIEQDLLVQGRNDSTEKFAANGFV